MLYYYRAYYASCLGQHAAAKELLERAEKAVPDYCFPNKLEDIAVLKFAIANGCEVKACYYLGNLFYDKLKRQKPVLRLPLLAQTSRREQCTIMTSLLTGSCIRGCHT